MVSDYNAFRIRCDSQNPPPRYETFDPGRLCRILPRNGWHSCLNLGENPVLVDSCIPAREENNIQRITINPSDGPAIDSVNTMKHRNKVAQSNNYGGITG